jgi:hypothetical protein
MNKAIEKINNFIKKALMNATLNGFIAQTAKDYDLAYYEVDRIYEKHDNGIDFCYNDFYKELEEYIKQKNK